MSKDSRLELQQARQLADELLQQLRLYQKCIRDPDATISLPDMNRLCQLADSLLKTLEKIH